MTLVTPTKTVQNVIDSVSRTFGDVSLAQITIPDFIKWINAGQFEIAKTNKFVQATAVTPTVIGQQQYGTGFSAKILEIVALQFDGSPLNETNFQEAMRYISDNDPHNTATGVPETWWEFGGNLFLYPIPSTVANLTLYYVGYPNDIAVAGDTLTIPDSYFNILCEYCLMKAYEQDENLDGVNLKSNAIATQLASLSEDRGGHGRASYPTINVYDEFDDYYVE